MERKTLLRMTQDILEMMESDLVSTINETLESTLVHRELRNTYMHLMSRQEWEHLKQITALEAVVGITRPTSLLIPETVSEIKYLKYDVAEAGARLNLKELIYKTPQAFLDMIQIRDTTQANVYVNTAEYTHIELPIYNDRDPTYWTSFDNKTILIDSFNNTKDATKLNNQKTQCLTVVTPTWTETDLFIPDMPPQLFPLLVYEAAEACMEMHDKDPSMVISKRALLHRAVQKTKETRHDGKSKKGFGRK